MIELELKFGIPAPMFASLRRALLAHGAKRVQLQAHYFDTADGLLARHRIALRVRREQGHWVQALKAPGEGAAHRIEHELRLPARGAAVPLPDLQLHAEGPAAAVVAQLLQAAPTPQLTARHGTRISRLQCVLHVGETEIEAALDTGQAVAGARRVTIRELELEHRAGPVQGLFDLAESWMAHGGLWLSTINKAQRGERLMRGASDAAMATRARDVPLAKHADGATVMRALLQSALEQVLANASEAAEGRASVDVIHQLRVGLRRLRTLLRELADWSPAIAPAWSRTLAQTFAQLGLQRDSLVPAAAVRPLLEAAGAPWLDLQLPAGMPDPGALVREPGFQQTLLQILALAHAGPASFARLTPPELRAHLVEQLTRLHSGIGKQARHFERLPLEQQHRVRKRLKRQRYLLDFTAALWPQAELKRTMKAVRRAQQVLGTHNDVAVAAQAFRSEAGEHPEAWFAAGWLQAHQAVTARAAGQALLKMVAAPVFWRRG